MDKTERYDSWALYKQAQYLANVVQQEYDSEDILDVWNAAYEVCTNHEWAISYYKDAVRQSPEDASIVNEVAWTLTVSNFEDLKRARYARTIMDTLMASNAEARKRPEYLDTWAAAHAANGDFERAVELQQEALAQAEALEFDSVMDILREHLDAFRERETITETAP